MKVKIVLFFLIITGFFYRLSGLGNNYSFWSDEAHAAAFARAIIERGKPVLANGYHTGAYQWLLYWLSAISAKVFGLNEFALRFPSVVFGVLVIWAVYLLGKELFNKKIGLLAVFLTTFLKIEILMSRQARPYQPLQFFYLLGAYFVYKVAKSKKLEIKNFLGFLSCGILATLFHQMGLMVFVCGLLFLCLTNFPKLKKSIVLTLVVLLVSLVVFWGEIKLVIRYFGSINNLFYYRVFLTHNYLFLSLLAGIGGLRLWFKKETGKIVLFLIFLGIQLLAVSFFSSQPFSRYLYPVFPFIVLLAAYGVAEIIRLVDFVFFASPRRNFETSLLVVAIVLLVFGMKDKFAFLPQKTYSLNEDMQEVPEVDWKKIYQLVGERLKTDPEAVLITNWNDLPIWHLGEGTLDYLARKDSREVDPVSGAKMVDSLGEFQKIVESRKSGLVILDSWDDWVPEGVREYCRDNLKKELEVDRLYEKQPRYWPVNVYSWGMETPS